MEDLVALEGGLRGPHPAVHGVVSRRAERHAPSAERGPIGRLGVLADADAGVAAAPEVVVVVGAGLVLLLGHVDVGIEERALPGLGAEPAGDVGAGGLVAACIAVGLPAKGAEVRRVERERVRRTVADALQATVAERLVQQLLRRLERRRRRNAREALARAELRRERQTVQAKRRQTRRPPCSSPDTASPDERNFTSTAPDGSPSSQWQSVSHASWHNASDAVPTTTSFRHAFTDSTYSGSPDATPSPRRCPTVNRQYPW